MSNFHTPTQLTAANPAPTVVAPEWVSAAQTATILGLSKSTISRLIERGTLPSRTIGSRKLVPLAALRALHDETMADFDPEALRRSPRPST